MARPGRKLALTREIADRILAFCREEGVAPFLSIAALRAGVNKHTAWEWLNADYVGDYPVVDYFRTEYGKIKGEFLARITREIQHGDQDREGTRQKAWLLTCLEREDFDLRREAKAMTDKRPPPTEPAGAHDSPTVAAAADDLGTPEVANGPKVH